MINGRRIPNPEPLLLKYNLNYHEWNSFDNTLVREKAGGFFNLSEFLFPCLSFIFVSMTCFPLSQALASNLKALLCVCSLVFICVYIPCHFEERLVTNTLC